MAKNPSANAGDARDVGSDPWVGKIPCGRAWQPTPVFLPREPHGQRGLAGYSRAQLKLLGTHAHTHTCTQTGSKLQLRGNANKVKYQTFPCRTFHSSHTVSVFYFLILPCFT